MNGIHGQYRSSPTGCITGIIALFLIGAAIVFLVLALTAPEPAENEEGAHPAGFVIIAVMFISGLGILVRSFRRLRRNASAGRIDKM